MANLEFGTGWTHRFLHGLRESPLRAARTSRTSTTFAGRFFLKKISASLSSRTPTTYAGRFIFIFIFIFRAARKSRTSTKCAGRCNPCLGLGFRV